MGTKLSRWLFIKFISFVCTYKLKCNHQRLLEKIKQNLITTRFVQNAFFSWCCRWSCNELNGPKKMIFKENPYNSIAVCIFKLWKNPSYVYTNTQIFGSGISGLWQIVFVVKSDFTTLFTVIKLLFFVNKTFFDGNRNGFYWGDVWVEFYRNVHLTKNHVNYQI